MQINSYTPVIPAGGKSANTGTISSLPVSANASEVDTKNSASLPPPSTRIVPTEGVNTPVNRVSSSTSVSKAEQQQEQQKQQVLQELASRDREVKQHELAHKAAGGRYAGAITYDFQRGPDGVMYAVGGSVSIDTSPVPGDPKATLEKAETIVRAALAPAEPSTQDLKVAASARAMANEARVELQKEQAEKLAKETESSDETASQTISAEQEEETPALSTVQEFRSEAETEEESQREKREEIAEALKEQRQETAEKLKEFVRQLSEIQEKIKELNLRLVETGALQRLNEPGSLFDTQA
ncbi:putative metalloprotease CJM1_0395 family protein [Nitrincola nitratireducens]|uniref:SprA-related family protein n=1 Tax=Nitrincola nitratireducens TaxID=1229521 RepID=W9VM93_9GAMM|nr:putative metalloprotease CJM1_0395 family protein [Nitrincola nitratireducens]EXJ11635.1 SprA-related family protein [Nitrincola nitratireducens]